MIYVAVDFATESLQTQLRAAGIGLDQPTYFSWLGVSQYIDGTACDATLRLIAGCPAGSEVVFDFIVRNDLLSPDERAFTDAACSASTVRGEPWLSYFDPLELREAPCFARLQQGAATYAARCRCFVLCRATVRCDTVGSLAAGVGDRVNQRLRPDWDRVMRPKMAPFNTMPRALLLLLLLLFWGCQAFAGQDA